MESFVVYVLELEGAKYYVGKTTQTVSDRYEQHMRGDGAEWTKLYKPTKILENYETSDKYDEDKTTKKYMGEYGIENVRGGSYTKIVLEEWQIKSLEHELKGSNDLCYKCGKSGHFSSECEENVFNEYLNKFTTIEEVEKEIKRLELDLQIINILDINIEILKKSLYYIDKNNIQYNDIQNKFNFIKQVFLPNNNYTCDYNILLKQYSNEGEEMKFKKYINELFDDLPKLFEIKIDIFKTLELCLKNFKNILLVKNSNVNKVTLDEINLENIINNRLSYSILNNGALLNNIKLLKLIWDGKKINLDVFEEIKIYKNINIVINKIYLFRLQNEVQLKNILNKYSKNDIKSFENEVYKKIELLIKKQIKLMDDN